MKENFTVHDHERASLREYLQPFDAWFKYVVEFECMGNLDLITRGNEGQHQNTFHFPWAFAYPVYEEILREKYPENDYIYPGDVSKFTDEDFRRWGTILGARLQPYINNGVTEDFVAEIDSNYDYGVFIHQSNGRIIPFRYSDIKSMFVGDMPIGLTYTIASRAMDIQTEYSDEEFREILDELYEFRDCTEDWVQLELEVEDMKGNKVPLQICELINENNYEPFEIMDAMRTVTITMLRMHAKCILLI